MNSDLHNPRKPRCGSRYPVVSEKRAIKRILRHDCHTVGKKNEATEAIDIFLCLPSGVPIAIVDLRSEVRK